MSAASVIVFFIEAAAAGAKPRFSRGGVDDFVSRSRRVSVSVSVSKCQMLHASCHVSMRRLQSSWILVATAALVEMVIVVIFVRVIVGIGVVVMVVVCR